VRIGLASDHIGFELKQGHATDDLSAGQAGQAGYHAITDQLASVIRGRVDAAFSSAPRRREPARSGQGKRSPGPQKEMPVFASEMHVECGGAGGRTFGCCLQAAAELGRFFERSERQKDGSPASSKKRRTNVYRRSSKTEAGSRKKREAA